MIRINLSTTHEMKTKKLKEENYEREIFFSFMIARPIHATEC